MTLNLHSFPSFETDLGGNFIFATTAKNSAGQDETISFIDTDHNGPDAGDIYIGENGERCELMNDDGSVVLHTYRYGGEEINHVIDADDKDYGSCELAPVAVKEYRDFLAPADPASIWERGGDIYYDVNGDGKVDGGDQLLTSGLYFNIEDTGIDGDIALVLDLQRTPGYDEPVRLNHVPAQNLYRHFH
ncbi:MAG: hypothetical protein HYU99_07075 [Deltaproteobacteria bacterium]|nr:hypothetical protein [Deltaproteobacteria bacterium]